MKKSQKIALITAIVVICVVGFWLWRTPGASLGTNANTPSAAAGLTAAQAEDKVRALPEVKEWAATLTKTGSVPHVEMDSDDGGWLIHAYEIVTDKDSSHTATFGWYNVDKKTGAVESAF